MNTMSTKILLLAVAGLAGISFWTSNKHIPKVDSEVAAASVATVAASDFRISGPFSHENLSIFLVHAPDSLSNQQIRTLDEALNQQKFIVHETGEVNTLMVENQSDDDVLILPGDIVKGGRQDRLIASAVLVPAKSGLIAVPSFCVEHGRWSQRGGEDAKNFSRSTQAIAGQGLKNAALVNRNQSEVWENVKNLQQELAKNLKQEVTDKKSQSSLQLTLENQVVTKRLEGYQQALGNILVGAKSAVGFVVVVNGEVSNAEVFGSSAVLNKAWPKMLQSAAVEALAQSNAKSTKTAKRMDTPEAVKSFLIDAENGQKEQIASATPGRATNRGDVQNLAFFNDARPQVQSSGENALDELGVQIIRGRGAPEPPAYSDERVNSPGQLRPELAAQVQQLGDRSGRAQGQAPAVNYMARGVAVTGAARLPVQAAPVQVNRASGTMGTCVESRDQKNPGVVIHRSFVAKK